MRLDYSYHKVPSKSWQVLQDYIMEIVLESQTEECKECQDEPANPQFLFTAGARPVARKKGSGHHYVVCLDRCTDG